MVKIIQPSKVVIVTQGRYAGKKGVIIECVEDSEDQKKNFQYVVIAGVAKSPRRVAEKMTAAKIEKRSKIKPFIKAINYKHVLPTRYKFEISELKSIVSNELLKDPANRKKVCSSVKEVFEKKYKAGESRW